MYVEGVPCYVAFVAHFDPDEEGLLPERLKDSKGWVHGQMPVGDDVYRRFVAGKKTYIGQLELLAAVGAYTSLRAELESRRVLHMIDNKSAIAGLVKGYSRAPDSVKIVHAMAG